MVEIARIVLMGGMGYPVTETPWGMPQLKTRLEAIRGVSVLLISWKGRQQAYNFLHGFVGFRGLLGDSLGAGSAAEYAGDQKEPVDFVGGFQPSMDDARTVHVSPGKGFITVPALVVRAHCIFDPVWYDTIGLGQAQYAITPGAKTILITTEHRGAHPDDWGYSQSLMLAGLAGLLK